MKDFDNLYQKYRDEASRYLKDLHRRDYFQELYDIAEAKANVYQQCLTYIHNPAGDLVAYLTQLSFNENNIPGTVSDHELFLETWERELKKVLWESE